MTTTIDLPDDQVRELDRYCAEKKLDRVDAIRFAVQKMIGTKMSADIKPFFGLWKGRSIDARRYVDELRVEWDAR